MQHSWPSSFHSTFFFSTRQKKKNILQTDLHSIPKKSFEGIFKKNKSILFPLVIISGFLINFFSWFYIDFVRRKLIVVTIGS